MQIDNLDLETLKAQCRAAALGQLDWQELLDNICTWVDCPKAMLFNTKADGVYSIVNSYGHDLAMVTEYNKDFNGLDPRLKHSKKTKQGQTRTSQFYIPNQDLAKTDYFNAVNVRAGVKDGLHSIILDSPVFGRQSIGLHRSFKDDFFQTEQVEQMQALLPFLTESYRYSIEVAGSFGNPFTLPSFGVLVDQKLKSYSLNGDVRAVLEGCEYLTWNGDYFRPKTAALKNFIQFAFKQARSGETSQCQLKVNGASSLSTKCYIQLKVSPKPQIIDWLGSDIDVVMLQAVRLENRLSTLNTKTFAEVFGLTAAETRTLTSLTLHDDLRTAAEEENVSYETIRWHLKNIFQKTGYSKQETLQRAIAELDLSNAR